MTEIGYMVGAAAHTLSSGLAAVEVEVIGVALLDFNLKTTGRGVAGIGEVWQGATITKPFNEHRFWDALRAL